MRLTARVGMVRRSAPGLLAAALCSLWPRPDPASACDPNHSWIDVHSVTRRVLTGRVMEQLAALVDSRTGRLPRGSRIAVLAQDDASPSPGGQPGRPATEATVIAGLRSGFARFGTELLGPRECQRVLGEAGVGADLASTPLGLSVLAGRGGCRRFMKVRLVEYAQMARVQRDEQPRNTGLHRVAAYEYAVARVTVVDERGTFLLVDHLRPEAHDAGLLFAEGPALASIAGWVEWSIAVPGAPAVSYPARGPRHLDSP